MAALSLKFRSLVLAIAALFSVVGLAYAQSPTSILSQSDIEEIAEIEASIEADASLSEEQRAFGLSALERARNILIVTEQETARVTRLAAEASNASARIDALSEQEALLIAEPTPTISGQSGAELTSSLNLLSAERAELATNLQDYQARQSALSQRPAEIATQLATARSEFAAMGPEPTGETGAFDTSVPFERAQLFASRALYFSNQKRIENLEAELPTISARVPLLVAQISLTETKIQDVDQQISGLQDQLASTRLGRADAILQLAKAHQTALTDPSVELAAIATENVALAESLRELVARLPQIEQSTVWLRSQLTAVQQSSETVDRVIAAGRVSDELADVLRRLRLGLPKISPLKAIEAENSDAQINQQLDLIVWQDRQRGLADVQSAARSLVGNAPFDEADSASELLIHRKDILAQLIESTSALSDRLADQDIAVTELLSDTQTLATKLDRRLLWLPSGQSQTGDIWKNLRYSLEWITRPESWARAGNDFLSSVRKSPALALFYLLLPFLILSIRGLVLKSMKQLASRVENVGRDTYWTTPLALAGTFLLALPIPLLIGTIGGIISANPARANFSSSLATGLTAVSSLLLFLLMFRSMCRPYGLFTDHFHWSEAASKKLNRALLWFASVEAAAAFLFAMALASGLVELRYGLAVIAFIVASLGMSAFNFYFFKPKTGVAASIVEDTSQRKLVALALPPMVLLPLAIGLLPLFGFFDTATELQLRLFQSGCVIVLAAVVYGVLMRLFFVAHRRFAYRKIRERRAQAESIRNATEEALEGGSAVPPTPPVEEIDPDRISDQTRSILLSLTGLGVLIGLWTIWAPLLPALGIADDIVLWQTTRIEDGIPVASNVTLWNLILSFIIVSVGFTAARNIRGLLEVGLFERMSLDAGERYATMTILGYVIVAAALLLGLSQLGLDWTKLQWIAAALGVGLGFGLQEIVANFISGLIILFERPIRVGDTVSIGNLSGTVSNIKIRATTITDPDNRDVLIPNKSIITENVTNWSLNDSITRLLISVGVAYGSNIDEVRTLLLNIVETHPDVRDVPQPTVFFVQHGENSLDFELRLFVSSLAKRLPVTHEINQAINKALQEQGIVIPFPQRTIHISGQQDFELGE